MKKYHDLFPTMSIKTEKDFDYANKEERIQDAHGIEEDGDLIVEDTTYDTNIKTVHFTDCGESSKLFL